MELQEIFTYPYDNELFLRKQKKIRRLLLERENVDYIKKRVAILGGSTTTEIKNQLEIFLLQSGIQPDFYESEYNKYYEDAVFGNQELDAFCPEIVIIFTSVLNILERPTIEDDAAAVHEKIDRELSRFRMMWEKIAERYHAVVVQNNFDFPYGSALGSLGATMHYGMERYIGILNERFADYAETHEGIYIHDLHGLSARIGLGKWHDHSQYFSYRFAMSYDVMPETANNIAKIIRAILGKNKKCLVLDLDNTLWGGVIGDNGVENLALGNETPEGESYVAFQKYVLGLKERGVLLAVCSKNDEEIAKKGFEHPDSQLEVSDFVAFFANWEPKNVNMAAIAEEINIGTDSLVFIDDNPVERQIIRDTMPEVEVPEVDPNDVFSYIRAIEGAGYFEPIVISSEDRRRNKTYFENRERRELRNKIGDYESFLKSLDMKAEISSFQPAYFDRISQLTNKTNQFNLTTKRYTRAEIERISSDKQYIAIYGRLRDKFGDNGLVSVMIGEVVDSVLHVRLWLMSCRVLKRGMEWAMADALVQNASRAGCKKIRGYYYRSEKNLMVKDLYGDLGFSCIEQTEEGSEWELLISEYKDKNRFIEVENGVGE